MYQFLLNLLIKVTRCAWTTNGRRIIFVWKWKNDSLKWESCCPKDKRIIIVNKNQVAVVKSDINEVIFDLKSKRNHRNY